MSKHDTHKGNFQPKANEETLDKEEYDEMELLDRLESLREDMEDLGVTTLTEVIERIETMHRQLDKRG
jgi:hypothetical protein